MGRYWGSWPGAGYPVAAPEGTEESSPARETRLRTEIGLLSDRLDALKRELEETTSAADAADAESESE